MEIYDVCGWEYDEAEGYPEGGVLHLGTKMGRRSRRL